MESVPSVGCPVPSLGWAGLPRLFAGLGLDGLGSAVPSMGWAGLACPVPWAG